MRFRILLPALHLPVLAILLLGVGDPALARRDGGTELDRIAYAVDGAESSHAKDAGMWRPNLAGPQGPMQVGEKAALDVGGGNRFDIQENRTIGRAYLSLLHRRYGNWSDAVTAYNWGMGNLDAWIRSGRRSEKLLPAVASYLNRVLNDSGICHSSQRPVRDCVEPLYDNRRATHYPDQILSGLQQSGRPLPILAASGRPESVLAQSGRLLATLQQSGRPLTRMARSGVSR
jgi:hypothetical protein